jgi:hypothetical protein
MRSAASRNLRSKARPAAEGQAHNWIAAQPETAATPASTSASSDKGAAASI